jgi:hypothetical protein
MSPDIEVEDARNRVALICPVISLGLGIHAVFTEQQRITSVIGSARVNPWAAQGSIKFVIAFTRLPHADGRANTQGPIL